mmetsp:Transcript_54333/g.119151  ORF Transcript_54333/g.119151 Transcript_54333/m.119151 type:complete len:351 (-) Transcript_54333:269-1321(-)
MRCSFAAFTTKSRVSLSGTVITAHPIEECFFTSTPFPEAYNGASLMPRLSSSSKSAPRGATTGGAVAGGAVAGGAVAGGIPLGNVGAACDSEETGGFGAVFIDRASTSATVRMRFSGSPCFCSRSSMVFRSSLLLCASSVAPTVMLSVSQRSSAGFGSGLPFLDPFWLPSLRSFRRLLRDSLQLSSIFQSSCFQSFQSSVHSSSFWRLRPSPFQSSLAAWSSPPFLVAETIAGSRKIASPPLPLPLLFPLATLRSSRARCLSSSACRSLSFLSSSFRALSSCNTLSRSSFSLCLFSSCNCFFCFFDNTTPNSACWWFALSSKTSSTAMLIALSSKLHRFTRSAISRRVKS